MNNKSKQVNCLRGIYGCDNKYICALAIYLMKIVSLTLKISIDRSIGAPGHGKYVVDGLNEI